MELAMITVNKIGIMFIMGLLGAICWWTGLINEETKEKLSNLLLLFISPLLIFSSYQREFEKNQLQGLMIVIFLAAVSHIIAIFISSFLIKKNPDGEYEIERMSAIYSNCGFIGIPLINGILGAEGVFYITAYITVFNLFVWTHGIIMITGSSDIRSCLKALKTPCIGSIVLGLIFYILQFRLPGFLAEPLETVGNMNTPLAMLISGASIAGSDFKKMFRNGRLYYICFLRLLLIPVITIFVIKKLKLGEVPSTVAILAASCPAGSTSTLFAIRYHKNATYASELFGMTTFFSIITIPLMMLVGSLL